VSAARRLVQGVDVWLNTPRRPLEASGTSGMKAALNGVLNCSILDGWWAEAYSPACGFAIEGLAGENATEEEQDEADAEALYAVLEQQVLPAYYERDEDGLPARWIALIRESIAELGPRYGTARMVTEYVERLYLPAHEGASRVASRVAERERGRAPPPRPPPMPLPGSGGDRGRSPRPFRRAQQDEEARPERPDRQAEGQGGPPDRADPQHGPRGTRE